ncbi:hypothetical protein FFR93_15595 [Rhizobium sp. MHM7A]|nr:hypothetical protein FFR93_15595 [Rhizobium sp. MHM7A]
MQPASAYANRLRMLALVEIFLGCLDYSAMAAWAGRQTCASVNAPAGVERKHAAGGSSIPAGNPFRLSRGRLPGAADDNRPGAPAPQPGRPGTAFSMLNGSLAGPHPAAATGICRTGLLRQGVGFGTSLSPS